MDFRNQKVTAPLKLGFVLSATKIMIDFRNQKVTAPLKLRAASLVIPYLRISVTKKLRPH